MRHPCCFLSRPSSKLYEQFPSIPEPIQEYLQEVKEQLVQVCVDGSERKRHWSPLLCC